MIAAAATTAPTAIRLRAADIIGRRRAAAKAIPHPATRAMAASASGSRLSRFGMKPVRTALAISAWICTEGSSGIEALGRKPPRLGRLLPMSTSLPAKRSAAALPDNTSAAETVRAASRSAALATKRRLPVSSSAITRPSMRNQAGAPPRIGVPAPRISRVASIASVG
ncbi:hypothetical protein D9M72_510990 [compost metagenome]